MSWCETCTFVDTPAFTTPCADCHPKGDEPPSHYITDITPDEVVEEVTTNPNVDHPSHYQSENGMECIDEMVLAFGVEAVKHFCLCNVWKYRYRADKKNGDEDRDKANWYMNKFKELCGR